MKKTYDEWKADGYQVKRGSKAVGKNGFGKPLFSDEQVSVQRTAMYYYMGEDGDYEGSMEEILGDPDWYKD